MDSPSASGGRCFVSRTVFHGRGPLGRVDRTTRADKAPDLICVWHGGCPARKCPAPIRRSISGMDKIVHMLMVVLAGDVVEINGSAHFSQQSSIAALSSKCNALILALLSSVLGR